ncbi:MAG: 50S ribosomal protein L19 [Candidatus Niyogibacteria bacterium]|nr:50S ribosomal protein L19 [Candidatus Niyogibacteria bacterium]
MKERKKTDIRSGDTVRVWQKIKEGDKTRLQAFEGIIIAKKHGAESGATFTVRRLSGGFGVERVFPLYSPNIEKIELVRRSKTRRAKLYHIREKAAKEIKKKMKQLKTEAIMLLSTQTEKPAAAEEKNTLETKEKLPETKKE